MNIIDGLKKREEDRNKYLAEMMKVEETFMNKIRKQAELFNRKLMKLESNVIY